jgi:SNF2 family DNA or RNA helicase
MTRLQGTWLFTLASGIPQAEFFLWGEEWRGGVVASDDRAHPYCMNDRDLTTWLQQQKLAPLPAQTRFTARTCELQLPTSQGLPLISEGASLSSEPGEGRSWQLQTWQLQGVSLSIAESYQWLSHLPLHRSEDDESWAWMSDSLLYWVHVMRWSMSLMVRGKYLPQVIEAGAEGVTIAYWSALLDSATDQSHLQHFVQNLPESCRYYSSPELGLEPLRSQQAIKGLVINVLDAVINYSVRSLTPQIAAPTPTLTPWLKPAPPNKTQITEAIAGILNPQLACWYAPLQNAESAFRVAVKLQPPQYGSRDWRLEYGLQAVSEPGIWISAAQVWKSAATRLESSGLRLDDPHETFLAGLGNASKLFPIIESSLKTSKPTHSVLDAYQAYELIKSTRFKLSDNGIGVVLPPGLSDRNEQTKFGLKLSADLPKLQDGSHLGLQGMLNFKWDLAIGKQTISKTEFDRLVALNMPIVEINGEWIELKPQDIRAAQAFFENRKANPTLTLEDVLRISSGDGKIIEKLTVVDFEASGVLQELIGTLQNNQTPAPIESPAGFKGQLRPYQSRGAGWLAFLERWGLGACLADDMGLGKTVQLLTLLLHLKEQKRLGGPTLLICPTSVMGNWEREVRKFAPSLKVMLHHGANRSQGQSFDIKVRKVDLVITSYALAMRDLPSLKPFSWRGLVLDEAQNIKNADAKQTQAIMELTGQFRIALTGTPVENRLTELWSIMEFLNPGYLGSKQFFQRRFAIPIEKYGDTMSLQMLRGMVQPFLLRRLKTDRTIIQDLPEKQEMTVFCNLAPAQAALYQTVVDETLATIDDADGIQRRGMILALLTKLKQLCNHPGLIESTKPDLSNLVQDSGKLKRLIEMLEVVMDEGDRVLIFTQFAEWGKQLQKILAQELNEEVLFLYGSTPRIKREAMVDRFQQDPRAPKILILSLKAGGVGLNLTRANHVFHFDRWWNPAVENQATDRAFRIGQTRNVQVHKFICIGTLEEKIHDMIESKRALAEQVIGAGESWITELDTDQLRQLLVLDRSAMIAE